MYEWYQAADHVHLAPGGAKYKERNACTSAGALSTNINLFINANNCPYFMFIFCRKPSIMADASYAILLRDPKLCTGKFFIDEEVVKEEGITDLDQYAVDPTKPLIDIVNPGPAWNSIVAAFNKK